MSHRIFLLRALPYCLIILLSLLACEKAVSPDKTDLNPPSANDNVVKLELEADKITLWADDEDEITFTVKALNAKNIAVKTSGVEIFVDGVKINEAKFSTATIGKHLVVAKLESISSNTIELTAKEPLVAEHIELSLNSELMIADGKSVVLISPIITDQHGDVWESASWTLYANGHEVSGDSFSTHTSGKHTLFVKSGDVRSNTVEVYAREDIDYPVITLPVIVHIGHFGDAVGAGANLSASRVAETIDYVNKLFGNEVGSTNPNAADMRVRFRLATLGPDGQTLPEPGIIRYDVNKYDIGGGFDGAYDTPNDKKLAGNESNKWAREHMWDQNQYLNLWVFPEEYSNSTAVLPSLSLGNPLPGLEELPEYCPYCSNFIYTTKVTTAAFTGSSSTTAHEVGHALGLIHVFSNDQCQTSDFCPDTYSYQYLDASVPCTDNKGSVGQDNVMDYGGSKNTFTYDQRERVRHVLKHGHYWANLPHSTR